MVLVTRRITTVRNNPDGIPKNFRVGTSCQSAGHSNPFVQVRQHWMVLGVMTELYRYSFHRSGEIIRRVEQRFGERSHSERSSIGNVTFRNSTGIFLVGKRT